MSKNLIFRSVLVGLIIGVCWGMNVYWDMGPLAWILALVWSVLALFWKPVEHISWDNKADFKAAIDDPDAIHRMDEVNAQNEFLDRQNDRHIKPAVRKSFGRH